MEPHILQAFKMHQGLRTLSQKWSGPWDGTQYCIMVLELCPKNVLEPRMEPHTLQSFSLHQGIKTLSQKHSETWDTVSHSQVHDL